MSISTLGIVRSVERDRYILTATVTDDLTILELSEDGGLRWIRSFAGGDGFQQAKHLFTIFQRTDKLDTFVDGDLDTLLMVHSL